MNKDLRVKEKQQAELSRKFGKQKADKIYP
jgi:hypothetical protein